MGLNVSNITIKTDRVPFGTIHIGNVFYAHSTLWVKDSDSTVMVLQGTIKSAPEIVSMEIGELVNIVEIDSDIKPKAAINPQGRMWNHGWHCGILWALTIMHSYGDNAEAIELANSCDMQDLEKVVDFTDSEQDIETLKWVRELLS